jgi:hypothetical protein
MDYIEIDHVVVMSKESELWCDRSTRYEYEGVFGLYPHELIETRDTTVFSVGILSEPCTHLDSFASFCYSILSGLTRTLSIEHIMRSRSPIGYDLVVSSCLADPYGESLGFHFMPGDISDIVRIRIWSDM